MCNQLEVTEQGYYQWLKRAPTQHDIHDQTLMTLIELLFKKLKGNPGRRRIRAELATKGFCVGINRIGKLMQRLDLQGRHPRAWKKTTTRGAKPNYAPDLVKQDFNAAKPNQKWCGDITYIMTWDGWAYLATVIDMHSRQVVGWAISDHMRTELVTDALKMAITHRKPQNGIIFHSDKGTQYSSNEFVEFCNNNGITRSMGRTGVCYDNALAESFFATYKKELIHTQPWPSIKKLKKATFEWIEFYYNRQRRHSAINYLTPAEYDVGYRTLEEIYAKTA
jgi:transposase InsO family protein